MDKVEALQERIIQITGRVLLSRKETARLLGFGLTTLDNIRQEAKIAYHKRSEGGKTKVMFTPRAIAEYIINNETSIEGGLNDCGI